MENARTARRFLRSLHAKLVLEEITFSEIDKHNGADFTTVTRWLKEGKDVGVMSEAGCPGIADPGAEIAAAAQQMGAEVIPVTGPNSIILALMASGLNGQSFAFNGYLPVKDPPRSQRIKELENRSKIAIGAASRDEADKLFTGLSAGGSVEVPMADSPWGSYFGMFRDKYGIEWMVNCVIKK